VNVAYPILFWLGILVAVLFTATVILTGKGDAMSGGGGVRTTFKGKASIDDQISQWTLYLGVSFMVLMLGIDYVSRFQSKATFPEATAVSQPAPEKTEASAPKSATGTSTEPAAK
jgi:preprotein translocase subunit SecG